MADKIIGLEMASDMSDDDLSKMVRDCLNVERELQEKLKAIRRNMNDAAEELGYRSLTPTARGGLSPYLLRIIGKSVAR